MTEKTYPLKTIQTLALYTQGLHKKAQSSSKDEILELIKRIGCVQIDALQMVKRSQYIVLWSRFGNDSTEVLDDILFPKANKGERKLFEYWLRCASIIPFEYYRFRLNKMHDYKEQGDPWNTKWLSLPDNIELMETLLKNIRIDGSVQSKDFKQPKNTPMDGGIGSQPKKD